MIVSNLFTERLIATEKSENKNRFFLSKIFLAFYIVIIAGVQIS